VRTELRDQAIALDDETAERANVNVIVVADYTAFAELLGLSINQQSGMSVVGAGTDVQALATMLGDLPPAVAVIAGKDPQDSIEFVTERWPDVHVVVVSDLADPMRLMDLACAGASAVLPNDAGVQEIHEAVRLAREGVVVLRPSLVAAMRSRMNAPKTESNLGRLNITMRESEVLRLLGEGMTTAAIATSLGISVHTCRGHVKRLMMKLGLHSQLELGLFAMKSRAAKSPTGRTGR
jgi:DNA-binding NarL/FixJ family response regulator